MLHYSQALNELCLSHCIYLNHSNALLASDAGSHWCGPDGGGFITEFVLVK